MLSHKNHNPDVLSCLANLSADEIFTPPSVANQMLDLLPDKLWSDETVTFLDPCCKSGVFLREIAKRLIEGLKQKIPNKQERINHIFHKQLYGIAITQLTSLIARRSLYCSKDARGKYSVVENFLSSDGNIRYNDKAAHSWHNGRCTFCGASQAAYDRDDDMESHAYEFIHTHNPKEIFNMKFDVIVGNPPYQLDDGGFGKSAKPIYQKFVEQAKKLEPRYLSMIIPSRWFAGGKGLDEFRANMLNDKRMLHLVDFFDSTLCFPGVDISGGVCYFLWGKDHDDDCLVKSMGRSNSSELRRPLIDEQSDIFIRFNEAVSVVEKVATKKEANFSDIVSARKPFGFREPNEHSLQPFDGSMRVYAHRQNFYAKKEEVTQNIDQVGVFKVFIAKAYGERGDFPYHVVAKPFIGEPNSCCTETYLLIDADGSEKKAKNIMSYISTRFFRFLVLLMKNTQDAPRNKYSFVPMQDFNEAWTDEKLIKKYNISNKEVDFINALVRER